MIQPIHPILINKKVLVVDDDEKIRKMFMRRFTIEGFTVITAENGSVAIEKAQKEYPHIILLDLIMPEMDGIDTLTNIRATEWGKIMPIILLTNLNPNEQIMHHVSQDAHVSYFIKANISTDELIVEVKKILHVD